MDVVNRIPLMEDQLSSRTLPVYNMHGNTKQAGQLHTPAGIRGTNSTVSSCALSLTDTGLAICCLNLTNFTYLKSAYRMKRGAVLFSANGSVYIRHV